jgi:hypothetical protein
MEIQISPLVLILSCCRVGSRSIAERSLAVARLRIRRRDIMLLGASAVYPHFSQWREASRGGPRSPRLLFSTALRKLARQTATATGAPLRQVRCNVCDS